MPRRGGWLRPARRTVEATIDQQLISTGAVGGAGLDPIDGDYGYVPLGTAQGSRPVPGWTLERARATSVAFYRANPMARAIVDTYIAFAVGDNGVRPESDVPAVRSVLDEFWTDPLVDLGALQERLLRSHLLMGETLIEAITGDLFGTVRLRPIDVTAVTGVRLRDRNPLWPEAVGLMTTDGPTELAVIAFDDVSASRQGSAWWRADWQAVSSDVRGLPFLTPVLDWLGGYDRTLWNLVDRTALARYLVWDVTVQGDQSEVDRFVQARGTLDPPESGSVEVHNDGVSWEPKSAPSMSEEDTTTAATILTNVAGGVGLAKPWISEGEGANRAVAVSMAEPVRRRIVSVQNLWKSLMLEVIRYVVDQAVRVGTLPRFSTVPDPNGKGTISVPTWRTARIVMPEVAATDAQVNATIIASLAAALDTLVRAGLLGPEAARRLVEKAWADYMGEPWHGIDDDGTVQAWLDEWGAKVTAPGAPPGAAPGVDNAAGSPTPNVTVDPTKKTADTGAPS